MALAEPTYPPVERVGSRTIVEPLTDGEAYLYAILTDVSGLDLAEFTWRDARNEDGCWRAWPMQWPWWRCRDERQIDQAARSVGKSESIMARACAFPFNFVGQEMLLTAPEGILLDAITDRIEAKYKETRLLSEMLINGRGGINHRPFKATFANGTLVRGRIPQVTGIGVKGMHPVRLEVDEGQDYPAAGWVELGPTVNWSAPRAEWRVHGVTKGVQDDYFDLTQPNSGFTVHRIRAQMKPGWRCSGCAENGPDCRISHEREKAVQRYGHPGDPDYRRNVLGDHGDATNAIFVLHKFMRCVDQVEGSAYNVDEFHEKILTIEAIEDRVRRNGQSINDPAAMISAVVERLALPAGFENLDGKAIYWGGMDIGVTKDPSEILIGLEYKPDAAERRRHEKQGMGTPPQGATRIKLVLRVQLKRFDLPLQADIIIHLIDFFRPRAFALDKGGLGVGLLAILQRKAGIDLVELASQLGLEEDDLAKIREVAETADEDLGEISEDLRSRAKRALSTIKGYNFGEKILVEIDASEAEKLGPDAKKEEIIEKAGVKRQVLEFATDILRELVDDARWLMPLRREMIDQFNGQTWRYSPGTMDRYGRRRKVFSVGEFHILDAARMLVLGMKQQAIEIITGAPKKEDAPVIVRFGR